MSLFKQKTPTLRCGAIVDVGSGSVGIAIAVSETETGKLDIVWSHREYMLMRASGDTAELTKEMNTTLINAFLELGSSGLKALHAFNPKLSVEHIQAAICAPWSYTVTKTIHLEDDHNFPVTREVISQMVKTAQKQTLETTEDGKLIRDLGLRIITNAVIDVQLNGYSVNNPIGNACSSLTISHISALAREKILGTLEESIEKIIPKAKIEHYSFMYLFYQVLKHLYPNTSEICLVDITNEATEIGIVRDEVLQYVTYTPVGLFSLSREISDVCGIPKEEAYTYLKEGSDIYSTAIGKAKRTEIEAIWGRYEAKIAELFTNTGDTLSIPKTIFLHTSKNTESFFSERLKKASQNAGTGTSNIHLCTSELLGEKTMNDSALALSAHYFHTHDLYGVGAD